MTYQPEPPFTHGTQLSTGILLVNLGTPDEATPGAVRRYLKQFLSDTRVVEIPKPVWWLILLLVPLVGIVIVFIVFISLARSFGKGAGFGVGLAVLGFIFFPILGFGDARYQAPLSAAPMRA